MATAVTDQADHPRAKGFYQRQRGSFYKGKGVSSSGRHNRYTAFSSNSFETHPPNWSAIHFNLYIFMLKFKLGLLNTFIALLKMPMFSFTTQSTAAYWWSIILHVLQKTVRLGDIAQWKSAHFSQHHRHHHHHHYHHRHHHHHIIIPITAWIFLESNFITNDWLHSINKNTFTLNSLMASVCRASEGSVVRGDRSPSLLWHSVGCLHIWEAEHRRAHEQGERIHTFGSIDPIL